MMLLLHQLWPVLVFCFVIRSSCAFSALRCSRVAVSIHSSHYNQRVSAALSVKSSIEVDDTDDDYYTRLFEEELDDDDDYDEIEGEFELPVERKQSNQHDELQDSRANEYLNREAVEKRKLQRSQAKRSRRLKKARQMALDALGFDKPPKNSKQRQRFHAAKGVYARLLEALDVRQQEANERARHYVEDREAQVAALHANQDENVERGDHQSEEYLQSIEQIREQEAKQTRILTELVLNSSFAEDDVVEELSKEDLITVLRVRGNVKGARKQSRRETILGLLRRSFETPLY